jgi:hypothetical protein
VKFSELVVEMLDKMMNKFRHWRRNEQKKTEKLILGRHDEVPPNLAEQFMVAKKIGASLLV